MRSKHSFYVGTFGLMVLLGCCFSVIALSNYQPKENPDILRGKAALDVEEYYNENFIAKDIGTNLWALINYLAFNEGRKGVVIGESGWLFTQEEFKQEKHSEKTLEENFEKISQVQSFLKKQNIELMVALIPAKASIYKEHIGDHQRADIQETLYSNSLEFFRQRNIAAPEFKDTFLQQKQNAEIFLRSDTHWTVTGADIAAAILAKNIEETKLLSNLHSKTFSVVKGQTLPYKGDLLNFVPLGPFFRWFSVAEDQLTEINTELSDSSQDKSSADLFSDNTTELVLVGTSYSANTKWNFAGSIKQHLGEDLLNVAQEGKGPFLPMAEYLNSEAFKASPPRLVLWEIPERFLPVSYDHKLLNSILQ
ncbi:MAG TPA: alginate O-acetyltransferase [Cellvibrio sp.]|nr:alginate O-acetyltransferase [Cellvibrio sp.]